jgi:putative transposase
MGHVYKLIRSYRIGNGLVTDMARSSSDGGKGKARILPEVEVIVADVLRVLYLTRQKRSRAVITREIRKRCLSAGYRPPSYNTNDARIALLDPMLVTRKRQRRKKIAAGNRRDTGASRTTRDGSDGSHKN